MFDDEPFDDELALLRRAQLILAHAALVAHEDFAVQTLHDTTGVAFAPLFIEAPVIHAVTVDGKHVGRVRRLNPHRWPEEWVAVPLHGRPCGSFGTAGEAASALATITSPTERWTP